MKRVVFGIEGGANGRCDRFGWRGGPIRRHGLLPSTASKTEVVDILSLLWGKLYGPEYVHRLRRGVARHLKRPHRFLCFTSDATGLAPMVLRLMGFKPYMFCFVLACFLRSFAANNSVDKLVCGVVRTRRDF